jgi:hypothetical protein
VDGNLTCLLDGKVIETHWQGKYRGPNFEPWHFELVEATAERLKDHKGEKLTTIVAQALSDADHSDMVAASRDESEDLLLAMLANEGASVADLGRECGWLITKGLGAGEPQKSKVKTRLEALRKAGLARTELGTWELTERGKSRAEKIKKTVRFDSERQRAK